MAERRPPEGSSLIIAVLLIEAILFAGMWIYSYANQTSAPWELLPWFAGVAVVIVVVGLFLVVRAPGQRD